MDEDRADIERRIDSDLAVRRLVDSWLSRAVAGLPSASDDDPGARSATDGAEGSGSRHHNDPDEDPGSEPDTPSDDRRR